MPFLYTILYCCIVLNSATCHIRCQHCRLFLLLRWDQLHIVSVEIGLQTQKDTSSICWECGGSYDPCPESGVAVHNFLNQGCNLELMESIFSKTLMHQCWK